MTKKVEEAVRAALAAERQAICDILGSAEPNTRANRVLQEIEDEYLNGMPGGAVELLAELCEATADELQEWQKLIWARNDGPPPATGRAHVIKPGTSLSDARFRCGLRISGTLPGDLLTTEDSLPHITCPGCLQNMVKELRMQNAGAQADDKAAAWLAGGDTGTSSKTIWHVMTGKPMPGPFGPDVPKDPSDFGRCYRMLKEFPEWRDRLHLVAEKYPAWAGLVDRWEELEDRYERAVQAHGEEQTKLGNLMYDRMQELMKCPVCDGSGTEIVGDGTHGGTEQQVCSACGGRGECRGRVIFLSTSSTRRSTRRMWSTLKMGLHIDPVVVQKRVDEEPEDAFSAPIGVTPDDVERVMDDDGSEQ